MAIQLESAIASTEAEIKKVKDETTELNRQRKIDQVSIELVLF